MIAVAQLLFLVAVTAGAVPATAPAGSACSFLPAGATPIIHVAGKNGVGPLDLYPIGFSKNGRLAWLERRQGFDDDGYSWLLYVVNLANDRVLAEREFRLPTSRLEAMCKRHAPAIKRVLDRQQIEAGAPLALEQPDETRDPKGVELAAGKRNRETFKTPFSVVLRARDGSSKVVGTLWKVEVDSGDDPLAAPEAKGLLRSPWEPRVAVVVTQKLTGTEGLFVTMVSMLGARLDTGWRPAP